MLKTWRRREKRRTRLPRRKSVMKPTQRHQEQMTQRKMNLKHLEAKRRVKRRGFRSAGA
jgi:predicted DNA-binding protein (UPF0251 family)